jgi:hypothetical protein
VVTSKRRYTRLLKAGAGLATAFAFSISYGTTPTVAPSIEPDDDVLICDDLDDDGILDALDNCFGFLILRKSMPMTMVSVTPAKPYLQVLNLFPNEYDNS